MSLQSRIDRSGLQVHPDLDSLIRDDVLPGLNLSVDRFWRGLSEIVKDLAGQNQELLEKRDDLQAQIDSFYAENPGSTDPTVSEPFLRSIGYLVDEDDNFNISTENVDPEIASIAGPQLVVPVNNARYCINAANARWGSLYDALYGTDVIPDEGRFAKGTSYNSDRGDQVIRRAMEFLDQYVSFDANSYGSVTGFAIEKSNDRFELVATGQDNAKYLLQEPDQFIGWVGSTESPETILLCHHGLHIEIQIDRDDRIGKQHPAGIRDVVLESALTTIQDCEDSVTAVDAEDKVVVYRNWLGLMKGSLSEVFSKGGQPIERTLHPDRDYTGVDGGTITLPGRSLLLVRNVGIHMMTDAVLTSAGQAIPEGFLDALVTTACAMHDINGTGDKKNSREGSVYIVKPKLHGPDEVSATVDLFKRIEQVLGLAECTIKMGIMDEERRTTVNLKECIRAAKDRVVFINTGFLDRTGDEIHTVMKAGPQVRKSEIKNSQWLSAYEDWNVDVGNRAGLPGKAQIGKGMWPAPDAMKAMIETKSAHPFSGASCAWVPSPTAATLHAIHYHEINVSERQAELGSREHASLASVLTASIMPAAQKLETVDVQAELDNNAQGILGYVVRWVDLGIGCSKVPDITGMGLMEDRATLRISSQILANWLYHGVTNHDQLVDTFQRMAAVVDSQNKTTENYSPMAKDFEGSFAFQAALDLVFKGLQQPNGYTEAILTKYRLLAKDSLL